MNAFHICHPHLDANLKGDQIKAIQEFPVYQDMAYPSYPGVFGKGKIIMEQLHTGGNGGEGDTTHVVIKFTAILVNVGENLGGVASPLLTGKTYYLTAGAEYGNGAYVWVGQMPVTLKLEPIVSTEPTKYGNCLW